MSWLSDRQLEYAIYQYGDRDVLHAFQGIYPVDDLPSTIKPPALIVLNTDTHNLPGKHWKVLFIDEDFSGEVFDSLALPISDFIIRFMNQHTQQWIRNVIAYQPITSTRCGVYVLYYVTQRLCYRSLKDFCNTFSHNVNVNEHAMIRFHHDLQ